jgi:hypothetical protein
VTRSPLLFLIIVDILQKIVQCLLEEGMRNHPIVSNLPCPIIQYVDDMLILLQGDPDQARLLKEILDTFSTTTELHINYDKSTFVPINLTKAEQSQISIILDCPVASFP